MKMIDVMQRIEAARLARPSLSAEKMAHLCGLAAATYSRQLNGKQRLGGDAILAYARFWKDEPSILQALAAFAIDVEPERIVIKEATPNVAELPLAANG